MQFRQAAQLAAIVTARGRPMQWTLERLAVQIRGHKRQPSRRQVELARLGQGARYGSHDNTCLQLCMCQESCKWLQALSTAICQA